MAEGLLRHLYGDRYEAFSAGISPSEVSPLAVRVMEEIGIDISGSPSKGIEELNLPATSCGESLIVKENVFYIPSLAPPQATGDALAVQLRGTIFDYVITVCDHAKQTCPFIPAQKENLHVGFEDPAAFEGTDEAKLKKFRKTREEIKGWIMDYFGRKD